MALQFIPRTRKEKGRKKNTKPKPPKLSPAEKLKVRQRKLLHNKVVSTFKNMQFEHINSDNIHKVFDGQKGEADNIFLYENIIIIAEETISLNDTDHIRKKHLFFERVKTDAKKFIEWLKNDFSSSFEKFDEYSVVNYKLFYMYIPDGQIDLDIPDRFKNLVFLDRQTLDYFKKTSNSIKYSSRLDLFKFLGLNHSDIGHSISSQPANKIETAIIIPESGSGFPDGIQVITFVMQADQLMECSYVLRKEGWKQDAAYQRLIDKNKIEAIRKFMVEKKRTFIDSIIVSLPEDADFTVKNPETNIQEKIDIFSYAGFSNITMSIPYKFNSIGIIDGQHRVFSHYYGNDANELAISKLRKKRHLIVTGLFFDKTKFPVLARRQFESELFLQINNEQKKPDPGLLQYIKSLNAPFSSTGLAIKTMEYLGQTSPFSGLFKSPSYPQGIATPSILRYGLESLVSMTENTPNLHYYWVKQGNQPADKMDDSSYTIFCGRNIALFFSAVRTVKKDEWNTKKIKESKILSVTSIVGFIRAYGRSLELYEGPQSFEFYQDKLKKLNVDFKDYKSSHWNDLARDIEKQCWT